MNPAAPEWINAAIQSGFVGGFIATLYMFLAYLRSRDEREKQIADGLKETVTRNSACIEENSRAIGQVCEMMRILSERRP